MRGFQGVGRAALVAACILVALGSLSEVAFERVTRAKGCPVPGTVTSSGCDAGVGVASLLELASRLAATGPGIPDDNVRTARRNVRTARRATAPELLVLIVW